MPAGIVDACPECDSVDVSEVPRQSGQRGHSRPPYYCYSCGIRFSNPARYDEVEEEFV